MKAETIKDYRRVMNSVRLSNEAKQRIAKNCAKYATVKKIKSGNFTVTAVIKEKTPDRF